MKNLSPYLAALMVFLATSSAMACALPPDAEDKGFLRADTDGNKRLSPAEYFGSYIHPAPNDMWDKIFASLDKNKDGVLTRKEYDIRAGNGALTNDMARPQSAESKPSLGCAGLK